MTRSSYPKTGAHKTRTSYPTEMKTLYFEESTLKDKVFRSDSGEPISNSYILLVDGKDQEKHFDTNLTCKGHRRVHGRNGVYHFSPLCKNTRQMVDPRQLGIYTAADNNPSLPTKLVTGVGHGLLLLKLPKNLIFSRPASN